MQASFPCPVCAADTWEKVRRYRYTRGDNSANSDYVRLRHRILFEIWFPGSDSVDLDSLLCRSCGFMTYAPRPAETDVDAKYRFLQKTEKRIGGRKPGRKARRIERGRAARIYSAVAPLLGKKRFSVLDVGGGDGKLLLPFLERGHECELVDYNVEPLEGVRKVGDTLDDLDTDREYDVIICSHVLEHLAEPASTVNEMKKRLADGGMIYGEVPLGVWKGIGIPHDPVTHVNFFTVHSFGRLFSRQSLDLVALEQRVGTYNRKIDVVVALAQNAGGRSGSANGDGVAETRALLSPSLAAELHRRWRLRRMPSVRNVMRRLKVLR